MFTRIAARSTQFAARPALIGSTRLIAVRFNSNKQDNNLKNRPTRSASASEEDIQVQKLRSLLEQAEKRAKEAKNKGSNTSGSTSGSSPASSS